jgi:carboxylesterase type B
MTKSLMCRLTAMVLCLTLAGPGSCEILRATVTGGVVEGTFTDGVSAFKGIPFAAPPVGPLRWKSPQPVSDWSGVLSATQFAVPCAQEGGVHGRTSEDCLYLNIWTAAASDAERRPVMVWIHGGSFVAGATSSPSIDGTHFAKDGVVLVTVAYRLGAFGFLVHPDLSRESGKASGTYGIEDQITALRWVQANIERFGGDPARVTLFGESAGGIAVTLLAASPLTKGLFQRVISESGPGTFLPPVSSDTDRTGGAPYTLAGQSKVFVYYFDVRSGPKSEGARHFAEVPYVFGNLGAQPQPHDQEISDLMRRYWIRFADSGDPNSPDLPSWPAFTLDTPRAMTFAQTASAQPFPGLARMPAFEPYMRCMRERARHSGERATPRSFLMWALAAAIVIGITWRIVRRRRRPPAPA